MKCEVCMRRSYKMRRRHSKRVFRSHSKVHRRNLRVSRGGVRF